MKDKAGKQCIMEKLIKESRSGLLILHKVDFRAKKITRDRGTLHDDKKVHLPKRKSGPKCLHTLQQNCKICKTKK